MPSASLIGWARATTQGAILSVVLGLGTWLFFIATPPLAEAFPQQLAGLIGAFAGMLAGSLGPQWLRDHKGHVHHFDGSTGSPQPAGQA